MRKWSELSVVGSLTLAVLVACNDVPVAGPAAKPSPGPQAAVTAPTDPLGVQIQNNINALFPPTEAASLTYKWNKVLDELAEAQLVISNPLKYQSEIDRAHQLLTYAVNYIVAKTYKIIPPPGETKDHAAARLSLMMSLYVYGGPNTPAPSVPSGSDAVVAVVQPSATTTATVQTPTHHAGVQFPPGSLGETRIVVITQNLTPYPANCSGPLATRLCQYPQFYDFSVFPDTRLLTPAIAAVCHVTSGSARAPLADHNRFAIAHDAPANPADRVAGGTIVDGIEVLPFVLVSGLTSCAGNSYQVGAAPAAPSGALGRAIRWVAEPATRLASAIFDQIKPREAWAIDGLGGGQILAFSNFGVVDPYGVPDLQVGGAPSATDVSGELGNAVQIGTWVVRNVGTASARNVSATIVVATDTLLQSGVVASAPLGQAATLVPRDSLSGNGLTLNLPATFAPGSYYVGIVATLDNETGLSDTIPANNRQSARVSIGGIPAGVWTHVSDMPTARYGSGNGIIGGSVYVVGGSGGPNFATLEAYNVAANQWTELPPMPEGRHLPAAGTLGGKLFVAGGLGTHVTDAGSVYGDASTAFVFDPSQSAWSSVAPMSVPRTGAAPAVVNGVFYAFGGQNGTQYLSTGEAFNPGTGQWAAIASMPTARYGAGSILLGGLVYVGGGWNSSGAIAPMEAYDPVANTWSSLAPMPTARWEPCLAAIDGLIYAVGGWNGTTALATVEVYDPATNTWSARPPLPDPVIPGTCTVVGRTLFLFGGWRDGAMLTTTEAFTP